MTVSVVINLSGNISTVVIDYEGIVIFKGKFRTFLYILT